MGSFVFQWDDNTAQAIEFIQDLPRDIEINDKIANNIETIWADENMKQMFDERNNLCIADSAPYFFDNIQRIGKVDYRATEQDMLLVNMATTGITEASFHINNHDYRIFDVGGARSERAKWICCFDGVCERTYTYLNPSIVSI